MAPLTYAGLVAVGLLVLYVALSYKLYRRAFLPPRPIWLDDFTFTPFEFQTDYEEVELTTADGIAPSSHHPGPAEMSSVLVTTGVPVDGEG